MRYTSRRQKRRAVSGGGSFWLSFSDLMSALLLVFVLVMFYAVYQYLDMLEIKTAELSRQAGLLDDKEAQLTLKDEELKASQSKLDESEKELITQQAKLLLFQQELESSEELLSKQRAELDEKNARLEEQESQLAQQEALLSSAQDQLAQQQVLLASQQSEVEEARSLLDEQQEAMAAQQSRLDALVGVRARIIASLADAMQRAGIHASVDPQTGSITLDASVLFDVAKSDLKPSGMQVLNEFIPVYLAVLMDEENADSISEIIIEGHTDTDGSYMSNLKLSQERALSVMQYILSDSYTGITGGMKSRLRKIATANGRSYSDPIYDAYGLVDKDASRRVEFKFRLQDEQMIEDMRKILEQME